MKFALDENLPPRFAKALAALSDADDHEVVHATDIVPKGTPDVDLFAAYKLAGVKAHVTQDHHGRRPAERTVIAQLGLIVFVLDRQWSSHDYWTKAERLVRWWPKICAQASMIQPGAILAVPWRDSGGGRFRQVPG